MEQGGGAHPLDRTLALLRGGLGLSLTGGVFHQPHWIGSRLLHEANFVIKIFVPLSLPLGGAGRDVDPLGGFFERMALADQLAEFDLFGQIHDAATFVDVWTTHRLVLTLF